MIEDRLVPAEVAAAAWRVVDEARMRYGGEPVGTRASAAADGDDLNYSECFTRDFAVVAAASLARNDHELVRGFLTTSIALQAQERHLDCERPSPGLMPASFRIDREGERETLVADYGQRAIASVTPVDAALWWVLILRAYLRAGGDPALGRDPSTIAALERIVTLYLAPRFEMVPTLLVPEGAAMIDRRLGVYGHPLDVQALFFAALRAARELLPADHPMQASLRMRLARLGHHVRHDYWLDADRLNTLYRYGVEQFGTGTRNRFNIQPDTIPTWTMRWLRRGGRVLRGQSRPRPPGLPHLHARQPARGEQRIGQRGAEPGMVRTARRPARRARRRHAVEARLSRARRRGLAQDDGRRSQERRLVVPQRRNLAVPGLAPRPGGAGRGIPGLAGRGDRAGRRTTRPR